MIFAQVSQNRFEFQTPRRTVHEWGSAKDSGGIRQGQILSRNISSAYYIARWGLVNSSRKVGKPDPNIEGVARSSILLLVCEIT